MRIARHRGGLTCTVALLLCIASPGAGQQSDIQKLVLAGQFEEMRWPSFADYRTSLQELYEPAGFLPVWLTVEQPTPTALSMIEIFRKANEKGLDPEDYDAPRWKDRIEVLKQQPSTLLEARFDVALSVSAMRYITALHSGRMNPRHVSWATFDEKRIDPAAFLREQVIGSPDLNATLAAIEPQFPAYRQTEQALMHYIELARLDDGEKLPGTRRTIEPGETYIGVPRLIRLLRLLGDLPGESTVPPDSQIYDAELVNAVKHFQRRHGLDDDGRLGAATLRQLNVPLQHRVRQLQLALERWRWLPNTFTAPPIFVNIPDFRLRALDQNTRTALEMRVVVGRSVRTQTPVFSAEITHLVFRPYWNVPRGIRRNEVLPEIERDRGYLAKKNFEVTTWDGQIVTAGPVSDDVLTQLWEGKLTVRQKPGSGNSLGLVKLVFPNRKNVYLHDTPSRRLFLRSRRDFSHGCIRVEKPAELAAWVLRNNPGWTLERVREAMESGEDDVTVRLTTRTPVHIVYGTALVYDDGEVHFSDDIYGFDARLSDVLAKGYPYP